VKKLKFKLLCGLTLYAASACVQARAEVVMPLTIDKVDTYRAQGVLIRVIEYNTELVPKVRFEMIKPIKRNLMDFKNVTAIMLDKKAFEFSRSAAVSIDSIEVGDADIKFVVEYFLRKGPSFIAQCILPIGASKFGEIICVRKREE
jgi:hypothetical protein